MKYIINILILIALLAVIGLKLVENKQIVEDRIYHFDKEEPINVLVETLEMKENKQVLEMTGNFMPNKETKINSEMQGKITSIKVDLGSHVIKGQKLVTLDNSLLKLQLKSIDVKVEGLKVDIKRLQILTQADAIQGVQLEKAELGLKTMLAQRATILAQIKKTTIYAPFSGIITMKMTEVGSFAAPGRPLLQLTDINKLKFTVNVPESDITLFDLGQSYPINVDAFPDLKINGTTSLIGTKGNMGNSFPIQFDVDNTKGLDIKSGMFGKLVLEEAENTKNIIIPASAIVGSNVQPKVYKVIENKAVLQDVQISKRIQNKVVINNGLQEGDKIVTSGFINLYDGANITY